MGYCCSQPKRGRHEIRDEETQLQKSLSARTKGRATRAVKRALIPGYGKKGMGWLHPKRKLYNTVYKKTTFSLFDLFK